MDSVNEFYLAVGAPILLLMAMLTPIVCIAKHEEKRLDTKRPKIEEIADSNNNGAVEVSEWGRVYDSVGRKYVTGRKNRLTEDEMDQVIELYGVKSSR